MQKRGTGLPDVTEPVIDSSRRKRLA
jgi:hypothetical protein